MLGPKGRRKSNIAGFITIAVVVAHPRLHRLPALPDPVSSTPRSGSSSRFPLVQEEILQHHVSTLSAFAVGAVLSPGARRAAAARSDLVGASGSACCPAWLTETFRAIPLLVLMMLIYYGLPVLGATFVTPFVAVVGRVS